MIVTTLPSTQTDFSDVKGLVLLTVGTPNGLKISIALEELRAVGAIGGYSHRKISFKDAEQKQEWFLKINPNGRIPALIDNRETTGPIRVWESASILLYLARVYDTKFEFHFKDEDLEQEMLNWIFFIQGGLGPMAGQAIHFLGASEKIPYAINRYQDEVKRLFMTYDKHLSSGAGRDYLVGEGKGKYSFADICTFTWVNAHEYAKVSLNEFPALGLEGKDWGEGISSGWIEDSCLNS